MSNLNKYWVMRRSLLFSEPINIKQNGDRLYIALAYHLFQKLHNRLGLSKQLYLESSLRDLYAV
jgi:hypothetical protein